jgi:predicted dehydrogenase
MGEIILAGAGQLGSRYLQGLAAAAEVHRITVFDPSEASLRVARSRYEEVSRGSWHEVIFTSDRGAFASQADLVIVATSSFPRASLVHEIARDCAVRYWLLEKVLAPSTVELDQLVLDTVSAQGVWVNHWMRLPEWANALQRRLQQQKGMIKLDVQGAHLGLACNGTHYIDLLGWVSGANVTAVSADGLAREWVSAKRPGYFEVYGELDVVYGERARLRLHCTKGTDPLILHFAWQGGECHILFTENHTLEVRWSDQEAQTFLVPLQSATTATLVDGLFQTGQMALATLAQAAAVHRLFLQALTRHWSEVHGQPVERLPIT